MTAELAPPPPASVAPVATPPAPSIGSYDASDAALHAAIIDPFAHQRAATSPQADPSQNGGAPSDQATPPPSPDLAGEPPSSQPQMVEIELGGVKVEVPAEKAESLKAYDANIRGRQSAMDRREGDLYRQLDELKQMVAKQGQSSGEAAYNPQDDIRFIDETSAKYGGGEEIAKAMKAIGRVTYHAAMQQLQPLQEMIESQKSVISNLQQGQQQSDKNQHDYRVVAAQLKENGITGVSAYEAFDQFRQTQASLIQQGYPADEVYNGQIADTLWLNQVRSYKQAAAAPPQPAQVAPPPNGNGAVRPPVLAPGVAVRRGEVALPPNGVNAIRRGPPPPGTLARIQWEDGTLR